jgi:hypothetical protein
MDRFSKNCKIPNFTKIRPVGAELSVHPDGQAGKQTRRSLYSLCTILRTRLKFGIIHSSDRASLNINCKQ